MITPLVVLALALVSMIGFTLFRSWEARKEIRYFNDNRTVLDGYAEELYAALVMGGLPLRWRQNAAALIHNISHNGVLLMVATLRAVERPLARLSYRMRVSTPKVGTAQVSDFLKTLSPDKAMGGELQEKSV